MKRCDENSFSDIIATQAQIFAQQTTTDQRPSHPKRHGLNGCRRRNEKRRDKNHTHHPTPQPTPGSRTATAGLSRPKRKVEAEASNKVASIGMMGKKKIHLLLTISTRLIIAQQFASLTTRLADKSATPPPAERLPPPKRKKDGIKPVFWSGGGGSRTRVQTRSPKAFYTFSRHLILLLQPGRRPPNCRPSL